MVMFIGIKKGGGEYFVLVCGIFCIRKRVDKIGRWFCGLRLGLEILVLLDRDECVGMIVVFKCLFLKVFFYLNRGRDWVRWMFL